MLNIIGDRRLRELHGTRARGTPREARVSLPVPEMEQASLALPFTRRAWADRASWPPARTARMAPRVLASALSTVWSGLSDLEHSKLGVFVSHVPQDHVCPVQVSGLGLQWSMSSRRLPLGASLGPDDADA